MENESHPRSDPTFILLLILSIIILILNILTNSTGSGSDYWLIQILYSLFAFFVGFCLLIATTFSVMFLVLKRKTNIWARLAPLSVNLFCILLIVFFPFQERWIEKKFSENQTHRLEVVNIVISGEIGQIFEDHGRLIQLSENYKQLSEGNKILVMNESGSITIIFYTFRGLRDEWSGFMYNSRDIGPAKIFPWGEVHQIMKLDEYWYFVESY
ncbi:MAG: hypothetical protein GY839_00230 [candidate division Zixibacteria bacterium]|nr:hypothetical protein [candidate division Zixibacteria bacterium]